MMVIGIILISWGVIGIVMGMMMFGDIGVACIVGAVTAILCGIGFIMANSKIKRIGQTGSNV
jgi:small neutral amino acid transporter SnatA (MarC family)